MSHYNSARQGAAVLVKDGFGVLRLTGSERQSWLQGMVTNEVVKLPAGKGCYAGHLSAQGRLVAQMTILIDRDAVWLIVDRSSVAALAVAFDRLIIMEDVQVLDMSGELALIGLAGPLAPAVLQSWLGEAVGLESRFSHGAFQNVQVVRQTLGYDLLVARAKVDDCIAGIVAAGATLIHADTWDVLRTEAGIPLYGVDIDETTVLPELGEQGISYDKGCYIGQEVVARIKYIGHVNRRFVGFVSDELAAARSEVHSEGKNVGYITSSVMSPALHKAIALGFVSRLVSAPGTAVSLVSAGKSISATVIELPFVGEADIANPKSA